ncbi:unnamed protein product [Ectocarpus sp. 8 AP-2014]
MTLARFNPLVITSLKCRGKTTGCGSGHVTSNNNSKNQEVQRCQRDSLRIQTDTHGRSPSSTTVCNVAGSRFGPCWHTSMYPVQYFVLASLPKVLQSRRTPRYYCSSFSTFL